MLPILFADERFVVLNKPAGLPVHAGPRGGASVEDFFPELSRRRAGPWLVHRLDADTSGCLLVALRRPALLAAQAEFAASRVRKTYWAVVKGGPKVAAGVIDLPIAKRSLRQGWRMVADPSGQSAVTLWQVLGGHNGTAWLELRPKTGRTHQLRLHCAAMGWPILGDPIYGDGIGPLQLLARSLIVNLVPPVAAIADVPSHMENTIGGMGGLRLGLAGSSDLSVTLPAVTMS